MSDDKKESRDERVSRLKNKFRHLYGLGKLKEYVRYERAKAGSLKHSFPPEYIEETMKALEELILEHYENDGKRILRLLDIIRTKESKPFLP